VAAAGVLGLQVLLQDQALDQFTIDLRLKRVPGRLISAGPRL